MPRSPGAPPLVRLAGVSKRHDQLSRRTRAALVAVTHMAEISRPSDRAVRIEGGRIAEG